PDIKRVVGFGSRFRPGPVLRLQFSPQFAAGFLKPGIRAVFFNQVSGIADDPGVEDWMGLSVVERGNRHAPAPLARDAPVRTGFHRGPDPVFSPLRDPVHALDRGQGEVAEFDYSGAFRA